MRILDRLAEASRGRAKTQMFLAGLMWTAVGIMLPSMGLVWMTRRWGLLALAFAAPMLVVGGLKAVYILDRVAGRAVARIRERGDGTSVLGFFSLKSWGLIAVMMGSGIALRHSSIPKYDLGFLYVAVGSALLFASRTMWQVWYTAG